MNMFDEFLSRAAELRSHEEPFATAVVVRCEPPVSGKPGDKAIIEVDGSVYWMCSHPTAAATTIGSWFAETL